MKALLDTNILIDYLNGIRAAREEMALYDHMAISIITWMEVMAGAPPLAARATREFLDRFALLDIDEKVAERAVPLRQQFRLKLPDAVIWATAQVHAMLLVTRDAKGLPANNPGVRMPYTV